MSGIFRSTQNMFGIGPKREHANAMGDQEARLGKNRGAYYGNVANEILGQKNGAKKYADSVVGKDGGRKRAMGKSGASQLLGGG